MLSALYFHYSYSVAIKPKIKFSENLKLLMITFYYGTFQI